MDLSVPIPDSYWLVEGQLLAGEYPGSYEIVRARAKLELILAAGIVTFVDLTEPSEPLTPYADLLSELEHGCGSEFRYTRLSIRDGGVPARERMSEILATIHRELKDSRPVYLHCWGGIGRTGTVAGCWLVEQGLSSDEALERINVLRRRVPDRGMSSPETEEQRTFVRSWKRAP
jgi:hypothetical protein